MNDAAAEPRDRRKPPESVWRLIWERDGRACVSCGSTDDLAVDHIVPWSRGGRTHPDNLQILCRRCNSAKGASTEETASGDGPALRDTLSDAGGSLESARLAVRSAMALAEKLAVEADAKGVPETQIARLLGVDRMTVRKWLGKR